MHNIIQKFLEQESENDIFTTFSFYVKTLIGLLSQIMPDLCKSTLVEEKVLYSLLNEGVNQNMKVFNTLEDFFLIFTNVLTDVSYIFFKAASMILDKEDSDYALTSFVWDFDGISKTLKSFVEESMMKGVSELYKEQISKMEFSNEH